MPHRHSALNARVLTALVGTAIYYFVTRYCLEGVPQLPTWAEAGRVAALLVAAHLVYVAAQMLGLLVSWIRPYRLVVGMGRSRDFWIGPVLLTLCRWPVALSLGWILPASGSRWRNWLPYAVPVLVFTVLGVAAVATAPEPPEVPDIWAPWAEPPVPPLPDAHRSWSVSTIGVCVVVLHWLTIGWPSVVDRPVVNAWYFRAGLRRQHPFLQPDHRNSAEGLLWLRYQTGERARQIQQIIDQLLALAPEPQVASFLSVQRSAYDGNALATAVAMAEHMDRYPESAGDFGLNAMLCYGVGEALACGKAVPTDLVTRARTALPEMVAHLPVANAKTMAAVWALVDGDPSAAVALARAAARHAPNRRIRARARLAEVLALIELDRPEQATRLLAAIRPHLDERSTLTFADQRLAA
ncbi:hypothetical protein [Longispora urticae]